MVKVLIMEDDIEQGKLLAAGLKKAGHDVTLSETADEAWAELISEVFDVLITDIFVRNRAGTVKSGQSGIALIGHIRQVRTTELPEENRAINIIAITGAGGEGTPMGYDPLKDAALLGANALLRKPASFADILSVIDELVEPEED